MTDEPTEKSAEEAVLDRSSPANSQTYPRNYNLKQMVEQESSCSIRSICSHVDVVIPACATSANQSCQVPRRSTNDELEPAVDKFCTQ